MELCEQLDQQVLTKWKEELLAELDTRQASYMAAASEALEQRHIQALEEVREPAVEALRQVREAMLVKASLYDLRHQIQEQGSRIGILTNDLVLLLQTIKHQETQHSTDLNSLSMREQSLQDQISAVNSICVDHGNTLMALQSDMQELNQFRDGFSSQVLQCQWLQKNFEAVASDLQDYKVQSTQFLEGQLRSIHDELTNMQGGRVAGPDAGTGAQSDPQSQKLALTSPAATICSGSFTCNDLQRQAERRAEFLLHSFREQERQRRMAEQQETAAVHTETGREKDERRSPGYEQENRERSPFRTGGPRRQFPATTAGKLPSGEKKTVGAPAALVTRARARSEWDNTVQGQKALGPAQKTGSSTRNRSGSPGAKRSCSPQSRRPGQPGLAPKQMTASGAQMPGGGKGPPQSRDGISSKGLPTRSPSREGYRHTPSSGPSGRFSPGAVATV